MEIRKAVRSGKTLPAGVRSDPGVYRPRESIWKRLMAWVRPKKGCGCKKRKKWLNELWPGLGDFVELVTRYTGIKRLVDWWHKS